MKARATWRLTLGNESGYVCYSSFAVTPAYLAENPDTVQRFVNGYARAQQLGCKQ